MIGEVPPRAPPFPRDPRCPRCICSGVTSELLVATGAVYCTLCGWWMTVSIDLPDCGICRQAPAAIVFDGRAVCVPCRVYVVG